MADPKVDPGAFLMAVLTVGVVPLTEDGRWDAMNTAIAVVVGVVVWCYLLPDTSNPVQHRVAFIVVLGLIVAVGLAWPLQDLFWPSGPDPALDPQAAAAALDEHQADNASWWALGIGIGLSAPITLWVCRRRASEPECDDFHGV